MDGMTKKGGLKRVSFQQLPAEVREKLTPIMRHRKSSQMLAAMVVGGSSSLYFVYLEGGPFTLMVPGSTLALLGAKALTDHDKQFRKEELELIRSLIKARAKHKGIRELMQNHRYLVINGKGDLVGKRRDPRLGLLHIGRRRIPTRPKDIKKKLVLGRKQTPGQKRTLLRRGWGRR